MKISRKVGCALLPLGYGVLSMIAAIAFSQSADDFAISYIALLVIGLPAIFVGYLIYGGLKGGERLGVALRRRSDEAAQAVKTQLAAEREAAAIKRMGDRGRHQRASMAPSTSFWGIADGDGGDRATFTYRNEDGEVSQRTVSRWIADDDYIQGYCLRARALRTFRRDRIENWRAE